jgi:hypothetical protein
MGTSEMKRWYFISAVENHQVEGKSLIIMFLKEIALLKESSKLASFEKRRFNRLTAQLKLKRGCAITKRQAETRLKLAEPAGAAEPIVDD